MALSATFAAFCCSLSKQHMTETDSCSTVSSVMSPHSERMFRFLYVLLSLSVISDKTFSFSSHLIHMKIMCEIHEKSVKIMSHKPAMTYKGTSVTPYHS